MASHSGEGKKSFFYKGLTWTAAGLAATWGLLVTISDPQTFDNVVTFPKRVTNYFTSNEAPKYDAKMAEILIVGMIQKNLENMEFISEEQKSLLAQHMTKKCLKKPINIDETPHLEDNTLTAYIDNTGFNSALLISQVVSFCSYQIGFELAAIGVTGLRQHVDNPGNAPMKNNLARLGFGELPLFSPNQADDGLTDLSAFEASRIE